MLCGFPGFCLSNKVKKQYHQLDKNNKLIWNFRDIGHTMRSISEGKGSQKRVLILLWETKGMPQKELTSRMGVQPGSASEVIGKLETAGLIVRTPSETDHRTADICLTEAGEVLAQEAYIRRTQRHEQMFAALTEQEKDELIVLLEKINQDWDKKYRTQGGK